MNHKTSVRNINILYLSTILLIIIFGSFLQNISFGWGLLATELFLILAPTLFYLRRSGQPLRQALRLNRISPGVGLAALLIGGGTWLVAAILSGIMTVLTGYSVSMSPGSIPSNSVDALIVVFGFCIAAPVCEEILFRGAVFGAYRAVKSAKMAIIITSLMFAFYHLQLQGLIPLLPIAFMVTYTAWRASSLYASMLVHFANNALASFVLVMYGFRPEVTLPFPSLPAAGVGVLMLAAGVLLLNRLVPQPSQSSQDVERTVLPSSWISRYWPLAAAAVLFLVMAGIEIVTFARPELTAKPGLALTAPVGWEKPAAFRYEIQNKANQVVGEMNCQRLPADHVYTLECQTHIEAYHITANGGNWMSSGADASLSARWSDSDLQLVSMDGRVNFASGGWYSWIIFPHEDQLQMEVRDDSGKQQIQLLPPGAWVNYEWPLRVMAADLKNSQANLVNLAWQNTYRPETNDSGPISSSEVLVVRSAEKLAQNKVWRVTVGDYTLWYAFDEPHTLMKYDDGFETYILKEWN